MNKKYLLLISLILFFIITLLVYLFELGGGSNDLLTNILYLIPPLLAVWAGVYIVRTYGSKNIHGKALTYITMGLGAWLIGEIIWIIFEFILVIDPFPSIADFFYLIAYPFLLIGLIKEIKTGKIEWTPKSRAVILIISLLLTLVVIYFGIYLAYDLEATFLENSIAIFYGIGDIALIIATMLVLMLALEYKEGKLFFCWLYFFIGMALTLIADILFAIYTEPYEAGIGLYYNIDLIWILGYLFFAYSLFTAGFVIREIPKSFLEKLQK